MTTGAVLWTWLAVSFAAAFALSLFHACLGSLSKISLSRFLEDRDKDFRTGLLQDFDEIRVAVEYLRNILILVFVVGLAAALRGQKLWLLWLFLLAAGFYSILFGLVPRLLNVAGRTAILKTFLRVVAPIRFFGAPVLSSMRALGRRESRREEKEED